MPAPILEGGKKKSKSHIKSKKQSGAGSPHKIHIGPRGGKYVVKDGQKVYL